MKKILFEALLAAVLFSVQFGAWYCIGWSIARAVHGVMR